jgi:hypothetical protein
VDPGTVFTYVSAWAAQFHDDASPARVTDVLVAFAFVAGVSFAAAGPEAAAAFLRRVKEEMPSAGKLAQSLSRTLLDSAVDEPRDDCGHGPAVFRPSPSS